MLATPMLTSRGAGWAYSSAGSPPAGASAAASSVACSAAVSSRTTVGRSEEHTSELQSLMRISYAVFCLKKKIHPTDRTRLAELTSEHQTIHSISYAPLIRNK